tara:strand:+ start:204 stop:674 length:471 start_codon:yes stop_codon:yes gene_type:complete
MARPSKKKAAAKKFRERRPRESQERYAASKTRAAKKRRVAEKKAIIKKAGPGYKAWEREAKKKLAKKAGKKATKPKARKPSSAADRWKKAVDTVGRELESPIVTASAGALRAAARALGLGDLVKKKKKPRTTAPGSMPASYRSAAGRRKYQKRGGR